MKKRHLISLFICSLLLTSCRFTSYKSMVFGCSTVFEINAYHDKDKNMQEFRKIIEKYSCLGDAFKSYDGVNNIKTINETNEAVEVSQELFDLLKTADQYNTLTDGYFSPYLGELTFKYKEIIENYNENKIYEPLSEEYINNSLNNLKNFTLEFDETNLTIKRNGNSLIDLGGFLKGYILDKINEKAKELGVKYYFINAGSSSLTFSHKLGGHPFKASIKYLENKYLKCKDTSLGVSSIFEQYIEVDGELISHIISPFTGKSEYLYDFSIVSSPSAFIGDIFSTVLMTVKDEEKIKEFQETFDFSYLIFKNKEVIYTSNDLTLYNK